MNIAFNYSIIIPHKNCPDLLNRCIDSIPTRDDVQIVVVDDNSDEDKRPIICRKNVRVILLDSENSKGAGRARNMGLEHAQGKWLLFADADDYYNEGFLNVLDKYRDTSFDIVYFNFEYKDGKTGVKLPPFKTWHFIDKFDGSKTARDLIKFRNNVPWTKMVRHEYVKYHHLFFEETLNGNDMLFSLLVGFYTENITVEKQPIYVYLRNNNSIITKKETVEEALCRLYHLIKRNYFYHFIGHKQWQQSILKRIVNKTRQLGFPFIVTVIKHSIHLYRTRKDWIHIIAN
jgi:glycosyltransferase involved in cell wall biosynthesis